jgi:hypothetical protein
LSEALDVGHAPALQQVVAGDVVEVHGRRVVDLAVGVLAELVQCHSCAFLGRRVL